MVSFGILNLAHRKSHELPEPLKPGKFYDVSVPLKSIAQTIPKGHRLRLAISSTYWPMAWPSPEDVTLTVDAAKSRLDLPILSSLAGLGGVKFGPPNFAPESATTDFEPESETRRILQEIESETTSFLIKSDDGRYVINDIGTEQTSTRTKTYRIQRNDPTSCFCSVLCTQTYKRGDWDVGFDSEVAVTCDATHFHVIGWVKAYDHDQIFATRAYKEKIKRDCM
jgi:hypothetical protein